MMFDEELIGEAQTLLAVLRSKGLKLTTAESCTGGLIAALVTEVPGSSDVFERGFNTYSNASKVGMLGVPLDVISEHGAVSAEVAHAMALGALRASAADVSVAVTGVAGPGGGTAEKPVGLVHVAAALKHGAVLNDALHLGDLGRHSVRMKTVRHAVQLIGRVVESA